MKASSVLRIGDIIRELRKEKKWTQKTLSEKSGIHEVQIRRYENNQSLPRDAQLTKIANALGVDKDYFYPKQIIIDTSIDEKHPFNILQKKKDNGEELTPEELKQYREHIEKSVSHIAQSMGEIIKSIKASFDKYYAVLNDEGQKEADAQIQTAVEKATKQAESQAREEAENQIKLLTRIPEYQKKPDE